MLGIPHLENMWARATRDRSRVPGRNEGNPHWAADTMLISALRLGLAETMAYLYRVGPSLEQFERWILDKNSGHISNERISQINTALSGKGSTGGRTVVGGPLTAIDLAFWDENGYVILHEAVPQEGCRAAVAAICEFLRMNLDDPSTWYNGPQGHSIWVPLLRHPAIEANRGSLRIHQTFAQLWGRNDLWMNVDQCGMNPPELPAWRFPGPNLHWDTSLAPPIPLGLQAILYLTDTPPEQGAFTCVPGFHRRIEAWLNELPSGSNPREQNLSALGPRPIGGKAGDLIIWHHALPHGSRPNTASQPRFVQYMAMKPALWSDERPWR